MRVKAEPKRICEGVQYICSSRWKDQMTSGAPPTDTAPRPSALVHAVLVAAAIVGGVLLLVRLADVLLMAFGAVLVAVLLNAVAGPIRRVTGLGRLAALTAAVALIVLAIAAMTWVFGSQAEIQLASLSDLLPRTWLRLQARIAGSPLGGLVLSEVNVWSSASRWLMDVGSRLAANAAAAAAGTVIVFFAGLYLAYHPQSYLQGVLRLVPGAARGRTAEVLAASHEELKHWLLGQLFSMALVGATTGVGLALAGVPSPLALGIIAGLGQFVPVVGPMAAAVPGLLAALAAGPETFAWAALVYVVAAQFEANLVTPLVLRQMAQLPMAVTLFAVLAMGILLGPLGVLFATPLAVVIYVVVKMVYVEDMLGEGRKAPSLTEPPTGRVKRWPSFPRGARRPPTG